MTSAPRVSRAFVAVVRPLQAFVAMEASSGILLLGCAVAALVWANVHPESYRAVFDYPLALGAGGGVGRFTLGLAINDGLMAVFFLVVGLEIKRELVVGELNSAAKATLPLVAAVGGMLVPSAIYLAFNLGGPGQGGWGIPMATDIAFCVGILTLLGDRIPRGLVVFLTALAIFDDIGGILVIAFFYGHGLHASWLLVAGAITLGLVGLNRAYVTNGLAYAVGGGALWYALHHGGIHATIAGVILGLMVPARPRRPSSEVLRELAEHTAALAGKPADEDLDGAEILAIEEKLEDLEAPVNRFIHALHPLVAFFVMPVFALANSGVALAGLGPETLAAPIALGTALGLFLGKQLGIFALTMLAVKLRLAPMPGGASPGQLYGVAVLAGIGFTVALFIASLAFPGEPARLDQAKLGILLGSLVSGLVAYALLRSRGRQPR